MEVAVAFGGLRPEFAGDFHHRLHPRAVHFDFVHRFAALFQRIQIVVAIQVLANLAERVESVAHGFFLGKVAMRELRRALHDLKRRAVAKRGGKLVHRALEHLFRFALVHFERAHLVNHIVHHVAHMQRVQHAQAEIDREFQSRLAGGRLDPVAVVEQQHAEAIESRVLQREAVLGLVHAEAARTARARRKEYVVVQNVLAGLPSSSSVCRYFTRLPTVK